MNLPRRLFGARRQSASRRRAEAELWRAAKAEGLAQFKPWRNSPWPLPSRSVLECGSPLPLFPGGVTGSEGIRTSRLSGGFPIICGGEPLLLLRSGWQAEIKRRLFFGLAEAIDASRMREDNLPGNR